MRLTGMMAERCHPHNPLLVRMIASCYHTDMGQILIRNLDDRIIETLKRRAEAAGRSMEAEAREALQRDTGAAKPDRRAVIARMQAEFERIRVPGTVLPDSLELLRESRDIDAR